MRTTSRTLFGAVPLLAVIAAGVLAGSATAQPNQDPPQPGDPRATAVTGNLDLDQPGNACAAAGLPGTEATLSGGFTDDGTYVDITAAPSGFVITGVIVKGGNAYNVYPSLGPLPWTGLHAPLNSSGNPPTISHWFVCLSIVTTTTTTISPTATTTIAPTPIPTTTTTRAAPVPGPASSPSDTLASTGFDGWWLIVAGLSLLAAGAAFLASPKLRNLLRK